MTEAPSSKPKRKSAAGKKAPATSSDPEHIESPLGAREHLFRIAKGVAKVGGFPSAPDRELYAIVEEQFIAPHLRVLNRYNRQADEMLCQMLERDERFQEAVAMAKGEVF
jgi:hypothetical protein